MKDKKDSLPTGAPVRAFFAPRGPSAAGRLIREGLITPEAYDRALAAETGTWAQIMAMDEAALDAELGQEEAAAIDALAGGSTDGPRGRPDLRLVETADPGAEAEPYRDHYRVRLACVDGGLMLPPSQVEAEVREIRRLLMASEGCFLPDVVHDLHRYVYEGRLLVVERLAHGTARIEGCVAYEPLRLECTSGATGGLVRRRVNMIRLLAVRARARRSRLAIRLCLEAQLRGTVRMLHGEGPPSIGTAGMILDANRRALGWATRLNHRVRVVGSRARAAASDPTLAALRDRLERQPDSAVRGMPYKFVVANRLQLLEAARYHLSGIGPQAGRRDELGLKFDYDREDPCAFEVRKVADAIFQRDAETLQRLGLTGDPGATLWGPPATDAMSLPVGGAQRSIAGVRAGAAA